MQEGFLPNAHTNRHKDNNGKYTDGKYLLLGGGALTSPFTRKKISPKGSMLLKYIKSKMTAEGLPWVPDFFCSMFVYAVYEVALVDFRLDFGFDPYAIDPKFYHKILDENIVVYSKEGQYVHVLHNNELSVSLLESVGLALKKYEAVRSIQKNQLFNKLRKQSAASEKAIEVLQNLVKLVTEHGHGTHVKDNPGIDFLIYASLFYTRSLDKLITFFPLYSTSVFENIKKTCTEVFKKPLDESSTLLKQFKDTPLWRRLK